MLLGIVPHSDEVKLSQQTSFFLKEVDGIDRASAHVAVSLVGSLMVVVGEPLVQVGLQLFPLLVG